MLNKLVEASLRYKFLVLIAFGVVAFLGWRAIYTVPIDAFPDVTPAQVNIYTESPGLAAEDVEQLLTFPIESGMAGLPKVQEIRSVSLFGLSYVAVYFDDDMDIYFARRLVMERLQEVGDRIPEGYGTPECGRHACTGEYLHGIAGTGGRRRRAIADIPDRIRHGGSSQGAGDSLGQPVRAVLRRGLFRRRRRTDRAGCP